MFKVDRVNIVGENVQKPTNDLLDLSYVEIQDGHLKIKKQLCVTWEVTYTKFGVWENISKNCLTTIAISMN